MAQALRSATSELPQLLTITEVANALGVNVRHVRRLVYERRIPFIKWGHLVRFDSDEITQWLDLHRCVGTSSADRGRHR